MCSIPSSSAPRRVSTSTAPTCIATGPPRAAPAPSDAGGHARPGVGTGYDRTPLHSRSRGESMTRSALRAALLAAGLAAFVKAESAKYLEIIKQSGVQPE